MGFDDKKRYLEMYQRYVSRMNNYQKEIDFIESLYYGLSSTVISDMPKSHTQTDLSDKVIKIDEKTRVLVNKLLKEKRIAADKAVEVIVAINTAPDEIDRRILLERHIELKSMAEIMNAEGYSRSGLNKRYKRAVNSIRIKKFEKK